MKIGLGLAVAIQPYAEWNGWLNTDFLADKGVVKQFSNGSKII